MCFLCHISAYFPVGLFGGSVFPMGDLDHIFDDTLFRFHEEYLQPHFIPQKNTRSFIHLKSEENIATVRNSPGITILVSHGVSLRVGHELNQVLRQFGTGQYSVDFS